MTTFPKAINPAMVGEYPAAVYSGGGFVWDEVLEYRVWCHPHDGAEDIEDGNDYYYAFETYETALEFYEQNEGCEQPLALILQREYIAEENPGDYKHIKKERITEWPVTFLKRPKRTNNTIPDFLSPDAPANKLDILRGIA